MFGAFDKTFCANSECDYYECSRHPSLLAGYSGPVSISDFEGTDMCENTLKIENMKKEITNRKVKEYVR